MSRKLALGLLVGLALSAGAGAGYAQIAKGSIADFANPKEVDPLILGPNAVMPAGAVPTDKYNLAYQALRAGNYKDAVRMFDDLLVQTPNDAVVLVYSGMALSGMGNLKGAQHALDHAVRVQPKSIAGHRELGLVLVKMGNTKGAQSELDRLIKMATDCGATCKDAGAYTESIRTLQKAMAGPAPAK